MKNKAKITHKLMESILCWLTSPWHKACPGMWFIYSTVKLHWRKVVSSFPVGINYYNFLVRYGSLCPIPHIWTGLDLCRSQAFVTVSVNLYMHQCCTWKILFAQNHPPFMAPQIFLLLLPHRYMSFEERVQLKLQNPPFLEHWSLWVSVLINIYFKNKHLSMKVKQCPELQSQQYVNRSHFIAILFQQNNSI